MRIGESIKAARMIARLSQEDLADAIGSSRVTISKYETGRFLPSVPALQKIASALHTTPAALTGADEQEDPPEMVELIAQARRAKPEHIRAAAEMLKALYEVKKA